MRIKQKSIIQENGVSHEVWKAFVGLGAAAVWRLPEIIWEI